VEKTTNKPAKEEVIREFTPLGKYRVRLIRNPRRPNESPVLDIREYVSAETFEGFTRRGIRIGDRAQMDLLRDTLMQVLEAGGFAKAAAGGLPLE
jgi:hypothetical protein